MKNLIGLFAVIIVMSGVLISCDDLEGVAKPSNKTLALFVFNGNTLDSFSRYNGTEPASADYVAGQGEESVPKAIDLDGTASQFIDVPGLTQSFAGDFSVAAWINLDSLPGGGSIAPIVSKGTGTGVEFVFYVDSSGNLSLQLGNGGAGYIVSTTGGVGTSLLYVAATVKSNSVSLYINPKVTTSNAAVATAPGSAFTGTRTSSGSTSLQIGRYDNGTTPQFFDGVVDQVRIANYGYGGVDLAEYQDAED